MATVRKSSGPKQRTHAIRSCMNEYALPGSTVFTDNWGGYNILDRAGVYKFRRIKHS